MKKGDKVSETEWLLRRVYRHDKKQTDKITGLPNSRAFAPRPKDEGKLSVNVKSLSSYIESVVNEGKYRLFTFSVSLVYKLNLSCTYDPLHDNSAHALVSGFDSEDESAPGIIARSAKEVISADF